MIIAGIDMPAGAALAPMAGVTDMAFRTVCAQYGAALTISEMVSAKALVYGDKKSRSLLSRGGDIPFGAQIFGSDPDVMAKAAQIALSVSGADFIDINMGCPTPKIANNGDGSALMKDPELAGRIVCAVTQAVGVPVTVKLRKGWDKGSVNAGEVASVCEKNGASAITVHGRTRTQMYSGVADLDIIRMVKKAVSIPVIANGDVRDGASYLRTLSYTGADMAMIGRSAFGDPWIFCECLAAEAGEHYSRPPLAERMDTAAWQIELAGRDKGERIACLEARKHLCWYLHGVPHSGYYKDRINKIETMEELYIVVGEIKRDLR